MSGACQGYACPPENTVPASEVVVVRTDHQHLAATGGELDGSLIVLAVVLFVLGGLFTFARAVKR